MINPKAETILLIKNYFFLINKILFLIILFVFLIISFILVMIFLLDKKVSSVLVEHNLVISIFFSYLTLSLFVFVNTFTVIFLQFLIIKTLIFKSELRYGLQENEGDELDQPLFIERQIFWKQLKKVLKEERPTHPVSQQVKIPSTQATATKPHDLYTRYEIGLKKLLEKLGRNHPDYLQAHAYQQRLTENISQARWHLDTEKRKTERTEIIAQLNSLALSKLDITFNELCQRE